MPGAHPVAALGRLLDVAPWLPAALVLIVAAVLIASGSRLNARSKPRRAAPPVTGAITKIPYQTAKLSSPAHEETPVSPSGPLSYGKLERPSRIVEMDQLADQPVPAPNRGGHGFDKVELLSMRELEVLRLIADGCSNQEIAGKLALTLSTIKSHTTSIYSKLGVRSRVQAVTRARELGML